MMTKFKAGDKVRIIDVDKIGGADAYFKSGDTTHVISVAPGGYPYLYCNDGDYVDGLFITDREFNYLELAEAKSSKSERISLLESQVAELQARVEELEKVKTTVHNVTINYEQPKPKYTLADLLAKMPSPNQQRKAVIERAKAFVAETLTEIDAQYGWETTKIPLYKTFGRMRVEFVVNNDKRTVVALARYGNLPHDPHVITKAIAKCAPDDVFNADIGKAIALGRALGLDVSEFENAVKPTEVVVGHKVIYGVHKERGVLTVINDGGGGDYLPHETKMCIAKTLTTDITADTEAQY